MTREEAIEALTRFNISNFRSGKTYLVEALIMAIEALQTDPCEDAISRQAALDTFGLSEKTRKYGGDHSGYDTIMLYEVQDAIEALPSVQQEQRWIPCSRQLPNGQETVLVTGKMKYKWEKEYKYFVDCAFVRNTAGETPKNFNPFMFETLNDWYEGQQEYCILAWMPLPERYVEDDADGKSKT